MKFDTAGVHLRTPSENLINEFRHNKDFQYDNRQQGATLSQIIIAWIKGIIEDILGTEAAGFIFNHLNYLIIAAALIIVIYILRKLKLQGIIYSQEEMPRLNLKGSHEDINKIDPDRLISEALERKEFRAAVRYSYIKSLKVLAEKSLIDLKPNKTNREYIHELKDKELKGPFEELTNIFEWIWYGEFPVEQSFFLEAKDHFDKFNQLAAVRK